MAIDQTGIQLEWLRRFRRSPKHIPADVVAELVEAGMLSGNHAGVLSLTPAGHDCLLRDSKGE